MEAICSSKTSVDFQRTTQHYNPVDSTLHNHCCGNLKSCKMITVMQHLCSCQTGNISEEPAVSIFIKIAEYIKRAGMMHKGMCKYNQCFKTTTKMNMPQSWCTLNFRRVSLILPMIKIVMLAHLWTPGYIRKFGNALTNEAFILSNAASVSQSSTSHCSKFQCFYHSSSVRSVPFHICKEKSIQSKEVDWKLITHITKDPLNLHFHFHESHQTYLLP
jgi:hypothetical protein